MASAWGKSWGAAWGNSWGVRSIPIVGTTPSGSSGYHPWIHGSTYRKVRVGPTQIDEEVVETIVEAVAALPSVESAEIGQAMVERDLRDYLRSHQRTWAQEYAQLIALEYARQESEMAAVVMLWFEM